MPLLTNLGNRVVGYSFVRGLGLLNGTLLEVGPVNIQIELTLLMQFVMYTGKYIHINIHFYYVRYLSKHAFPITILQNIMCKKLQLLGYSSPRPPTGALPWTPCTGGLPSTEPPVWPMFILGHSGGIPYPPQKKKWRDRRTRCTNSWLDDSDKNFGPDLPLLFKLHEIWSVDSQENH